MAIRVTGFAGLTANDPASGYGMAWPGGAPNPIGLDITSQPRSGFFAQTTDRAYPPFMFVVRVFPMAVASLVAATLHATIVRTLRPNRQGVPVPITGTWHDGTPVTMQVVIVSRQRISQRDTGTLDNVVYDITVRADVPIWYAQTPKNVTAAPLNVAGTEPVYPVVTLTNATHKKWWRASITHTAPLMAFPIKLTLTSAGLTTGTNITYVYVNGVDTPFLVASATTLWVLVNVTPGRACIVDVVSGTGLAANQKAGTLALGELDPVNSTNTSWQYTGFGARSNQGFAGQWRPEQFFDHSLATDVPWSLSDTGGLLDSIVMGANSSGESDADALVVDLPQGTAAGNIVNFHRGWTAVVNATVTVKYRLRDSPTWTNLFTQVITTVATNSNFASMVVPAGAVQLMCGVAFTTPTSAGQVDFGVHTSGVFTVPVVSPTISMTQINANLDYYNGVLQLAGGPSVTFADAMWPDGTLTIDALNGTIASSVAGAPMFGNVTPSDPAVMLELAVGSAGAVVNSTGGTFTGIVWSDGYAMQ